MACVIYGVPQPHPWRIPANHVVSFPEHQYALSQPRTRFHICHDRIYSYTTSSRSLLYLTTLNALNRPRVHVFPGVKLPAPQTNTTASGITTTMGSLGTYFLDVVYSFTNCMVCFPSSPHLKINSRSFKILRLLGEVSFPI